MKLSTASLTEVRAAIERELQCSLSTEAFLISITCEHLRAAVTTEAADPSNQDRYPVPTLRLTLSTASRIASFSEVGAENPAVLDQLEHLARLSDLMRSQGKWYTTPVRLLDIDDSNVLIVGGGPVHTFPVHIRSDIQTVGRARIMKVAERNHDFVSKFPKQRLEDWLGLPYYDMRKWAVEFKKACSHAMTPYCNVEDINVWVKQRWEPLAQYRGLPEILLYRKQVLIYGNQALVYGMLKIHTSQGKLPQVLGICEIQKNDARRMQSCSNDSSNIERIQYMHRGHLVLVRIPHPLPVPESAFLSLGWSAPSNHTTGVWPKEFYFSNRLVPLIERALRCLGYELIEKWYKDKS